jgi:imidazolonepropionase-like amidohydrolase
MRISIVICAGLILAGCTTTRVDPVAKPAAATSTGKSALVNRDPFPSTYKPYPGRTTLIRGAALYDGKGGERAKADILLKDGKIAAIGDSLDVPADALVIDGTGKWVTPGIIDSHSHLGVYASPGVDAHSDGNEATAPVTAEVWAEHSIWPQDPGFSRALAAGVTSLHILPGSANLIGGRGVVLKNVPARTIQELKFPGAPYTLKMACGENPKRVYGSKGRFPSTRMGNIAGTRAAWARAAEYKRQWEGYEAKVAAGTAKAADAPKRDLQLDTLMDVLSGKILVHNHCYRADEMALMIDVAKEFGYKITAFHHAVEAYKIADMLAVNGICSMMWADWWGFKMESYDSVRENIPMVDAAGACAVVHSDDDIGIQRLNQEAAKALSDGWRAGLKTPRAKAWQWLSLNPAKSMGIDAMTGSLEPGKNADVVLWNREPLSVYAKAQMVWVDGALLFDLNNPRLRAVMDFELGQAGEGDVK